MILFISDLHLCASRPETTAAFRRFLAGPARQAQALWILGDLFEFWVGDDDLSEPFHAEIAEALAGLARSGISLHLLPGNRDFLLGKTFARRAGASLVTEPVLIEAFGLRLVLTHGDAECTQDLAYQRFRRRIRSPLSRAFLLCLPLALRHALAKRMRERSEASHEASNAYDLDPQAITALFRATGADAMIHGHTHRPARHTLELDGKPRERWVLADWHDRPTWLELSEQGLKAREEEKK